MKEFDLEKAKAGHPVQTRDGRDARILATDLKGEEGASLVTVISASSGFHEYTVHHHDCGSYYKDITSGIDLFLKDIKKTMYCIVYKKDKKIAHSIGGTYETREEAEALLVGTQNAYIAEITWEE